MGADMLFIAGQPEAVVLAKKALVRTAVDAYRVHDLTEDLHYTVYAQLPGFAPCTVGACAGGTGAGIATGLSGLADARLPD